jgi:hypothetical protein
MGERIDIKGEKFGRWMVLDYSCCKNNMSYWKAQCECGRIRDVASYSLRSGGSKSCGCRKRSIKGNKIIKYKNIAIIHMIGGHKCIIDAEDVDLIKDYTWYMAHGYVFTTSRKNILIHRLIMDAKPGCIIDHINQNKLDNRKCNLRIATHSQNSSNSGVRKNNTSGKKGVSWHKATGKWQATMTHNYKSIHIGLYDTVEEAAVAYDQVAKQLSGEFAYTNKDIDKEKRKKWIKKGKY